VAVSFIGEGAANQGAFHEALNLAAVWRLPVVFVIEDNAWGVSVSKAVSTAVPNNHVRAQSYGIPGHLVKGNDPTAILEVAGDAIARARTGGGPTLIEIDTYRLAGHFMGDAKGYRPDGERARLAERDPIALMREQLKAAGDLSDADYSTILARSHGAVEEAIEFARSSPYPAAEEALEKVFV
jgi:pyruvate dehydrogenase E1 component alpha subunit